MSVLYAIDKSTLEGIANAIREKKGTTAFIPVASFASEIASIGGSVDDSNTIKAGTYNMTEYHYGDEDASYFDWGSQAINGKFIEGYNGDTTETIFTSVENDGAFCVYFKNNGNSDGMLTPSWNTDDYTTKIIIDEAQIVSEEFKTWFNACFEKVENGGGGGGSTEAPKEYTLRSGIWTSRGDVTGNYIDLPHPSYSLSADINGTVLDREFNRIVISGYGQGMDENNSLEGEPYPDIVFYNGDSSVEVRSGYDLNSSFGFVINEDTQVTATFCIAFRGLFA